MYSTNTCFQFDFLCTILFIPVMIFSCANKSSSVYPQAMVVPVADNAQPVSERIPCCHKGNCCMRTRQCLESSIFSFTLGKLIGHVNEYPTMHYIGNPGHTQSMIAYNLTGYFWKFQWRNGLWAIATRAVPQWCYITFMGSSLCQRTTISHNNSISCRIYIWAMAVGATFRWNSLPYIMYTFTYYDDDQALYPISDHGIGHCPRIYLSFLHILLCCQNAMSSVIKATCGLNSHQFKNKIVWILQHNIWIFMQFHKGAIQCLPLTL